MAKEIVCDTSTIITLFSAYHLSTNKDKYLEGIKKYKLIAPSSVHNKLEDFIRRNNDLGLFARESLSYEIDFQSVDFVFDKLIPNRWKNISLRNLLTIKHAASEYLTREGCEV